MNKMTKESPFKFLDAYQKEDIDIFFGREKETEALYDALSGVKHLLVYGPSGAGKTSLIECGLRNQFSEFDWFALTIRKGANIISSFFTAVNAALEEPITLNTQNLPEDDKIGFEDAIELFFSERYQPVYLLFDQFEELLISGSETEQKEFFTRLNQLIRYRIPCRVLLIMREEFIGHLSEFEPLCPSIFKHRFRLEKMRRANVHEVITQTLNAPQFTDAFTVNNSKQLAQSILAKLPDKVRQIELTHVQVFLNELWERAANQTYGNINPILHAGLIQENDNLQRILDSFLKKQLEELTPTHGNQAPLEILASMISERHTKLQLTNPDIQQALNNNEIELSKPLPTLLQDLQNRKIIRKLKQDEQTVFEITHDILALAVGQNLTEEMQLREKAREVVKVYEGQLAYFSSSDLERLSKYEGYYPIPFQRKIDNSKRAQKSRKNTIIAGTVAAFITLGVFAFWALEQRNAAQRSEANLVLEKKTVEREKTRAEEQTKIANQATQEAKKQESEAKKQAQIAESKSAEAQANLESMRKAEEARLKIEVQKFVAAAQRMREIGDDNMANKIMQEAKTLAKDYPNLLKGIK